MDFEEILKTAGLPTYFMEDYTANKLGYKDLQSMTIDKLKNKFKRSDDECWAIIQSLEKLGVFSTDVKQETKIFNDPIHGHIALHPVCLAIIDTPQFQRLRNIKQLGVSYYVYPGASHNRFEHSLGVCYLAGQFARTLQKNQPYLGITEKDILCVEIAGLCHDLGHGPFSHVFDGCFIPAVCPNNKWKHEEASVSMLDFIIEKNEFMKPDGKFSKYNLVQADVTFIKEMINGPTQNNKEMIGRDKHKHFLFEIVSNKRNGIDVDKWDYFARDCHHLGIQNNFDHSRYMKFARVLLDDGEWQICIRDKEISNLYNMFYTRYTLHKTAYQHRVTKSLEAMITHALVKANEDLKFAGEKNQALKMSECVKDMFAFSQLTDTVLFKILDFVDNPSPNMEQAKSIIQRILKRDLYTCIYESDAFDSKEFSLTEAQIQQDITEKAREKGGQIDSTDFGVQLVNLDFGKRHENPVDKLLVFSKSKPNFAFKLPQNKVSRILGPVTFSEIFIRIICYNKNASSSLEKAIENCVTKWNSSKKRKLE